MALGFICVAGAGTILGIMPTIQKQVMLNGLPMYSLMLYTSWTITIVCILAALIRKHSLKASKVQVIQGLLMGVFGLFLTPILLNSSYLYLPVGTTLMLNFLYPAIVCVIMGVGFKAGFTRLQIAAIVVSILGMAFLTGAGGDLSGKGIAMAIASAFTYGIYLVGNEKGPVNELPIEVKMFYISLPGAAAFSVIAPAAGSFVVPDNITTWVMAIGGSGLFTVGGYFLMIYGIGKLGASTAAFVSMVEPIVSTVFGTLWFRDPVTVGIVAGSCLVVGSILLIAIDGYQKSKRGRQSKAGQTA